ncbi:hypothetical protein P2H44_03250 [Albimonas sp. CAU 1670]|uniref:calcium-binding protein n=1 Tax=Albimonas sp. CAU 1670 TaxID=3032599 RepID=UPI0023D990C1|nr:hypothetical protein [Albimonas sp. CAU 1670]MDF2231561.1 hypothetical protein [Albimonas sp. CAU 1670]
MAVIRTTDSVGAGVRETVAASDEFFLSEGATVASTNDNAIEAGGIYASIFVAGEVFADQYAVNFGTWNTGSLAVMEGGRLSGGFGGVRSLGTYISVVNAGHIHGESTGLTHQTGQGFRLTNTGQITSNTNDGVAIDSANARIDNYGTIATSSVGNATGGVDLYDQSDSSSLLQLRNHGSISAGSGFGVQMSGSAATLVMNTGLIVGLVRIYDSDDRLLNSGTIEGTIDLRDGFDLLRNNGGSIFGDVFTGESADTVRNRGGAIWGDLDLGAGNDVYRGQADGVVDGLVSGKEGNDTLVGGEGADDFVGGDGFDTLRGKGGDDILRGGAGKDTIVGGGGDDEMTGGSLSDLFVIGKKSGDDTVTDFENEIDVVDLTRLSITGAGKVAQVQAAAHDVAGGSIIDLDALGGSGSLELQGLFVAQYGGAEFIF